MEYRLNKYISNSGICSRREADRFIEEGNVTVNGKRAVVGMRVLPGQKVKVHGRLIENDIEPVYIAFNKPVGIVSTTDTQEKDNIVEYISHEHRIFPVGRLDKDSQGLILLTNDGDIVNKILRAGNNHKKDYIVTVNRPINEEFLLRMSQGVPILDRVTRKCQLKMINPYTFQITLIQGLNRQIRRMCEYFGYEVTKLERIQIMNIKLGDLKQGNWRDLTEKELEGLFDMIEDSENNEKSKASQAKKSTKEVSQSKTDSSKNEKKSSRGTGSGNSMTSDRNQSKSSSGRNNTAKKTSSARSGRSFGASSASSQSNGRRGRAGSSASSKNSRGASSSSRTNSKRR